MPTAPPPRKGSGAVVRLPVLRRDQPLYGVAEMISTVISLPFGAV